MPRESEEMKAIRQDAGLKLKGFFKTVNGDPLEARQIKAEIIDLMDRYFDAVCDQQINDFKENTNA